MYMYNNYGDQCTLASYSGLSLSWKVVGHGMQSHMRAEAKGNYCVHMVRVHD